jgi:hypothetical protein
MLGCAHAARHGRSTSPLAVGRYAFMWVAAAAVVVALAGIVFDAPRTIRSADAVTLAAQRAGCVLRVDAGGAVGRDLDVMQPPTFGPPATPAAAGVYRRAPRTEAVVGSLRRGTVVLQYRSGTPRRTVQDLRRMGSLAPFAAIVTPDRTGMRYAVAATAWGRLLGCPRVNGSTLVAVRAFAVRYKGRGPDAAR